MLRVSSGFQTLENNNTTRPAASWFQMFSRVWKLDETLALVFEIVQSIPSIFCWVCAAGFSEPLPYFSLCCGQLETPYLSAFGQDRNGMGAIRSPTTAAKPLNFRPIAAYSSLFPRAPKDTSLAADWATLVK